MKKSDYTFTEGFIINNASEANERFNSGSKWDDISLQILGIKL